MGGMLWHPARAVGRLDERLPSRAQRKTAARRHHSFTVPGHLPEAGIELIGANSPQAQGRVERSHDTHQHRLIKKMRLKRIATYEQAQAFLVETYLPAHNARYAIAASHAVDLHEPVAQHVDLDDVFCLEPHRTLSQDGVVQYGSRW